VARTPTRTQTSRLSRIANGLRVAVPQLQELELWRDDRGTPHLRGRYDHWRLRGAWQSERELSDGTLRLLGLLWAVLDGTGPLLLEEPELSLHINHVGGERGTVYGKAGKHPLLDRLAGYNQAAQHAPWAVLVDLDSDYACAPDAVQAWLPIPAALMRFRVAVREAEAWLLADPASLARYLRVSAALVPRDPEALPDAKQTLVDLARRSRDRAVREDMVPRMGSGRPVGAGYTARVIEFVTSAWQPATAATTSASLNRCLAALVDLVA
jgi:putative AbiEii toxin of type IV toxin-antitoxin system